MLSIVDASNLERNLYLVSQVLSLGLPTVVALNMVDLARDRQIEIDVDALAKRLGVPVVAVQANRRVGLDELKAALADGRGRRSRAERENPFPAAFQRADGRSWPRALNAASAASRCRSFWSSGCCSMATAIWKQTLLNGDGDGSVRRSCERPASRSPRPGCRVPAVEAMARYDWVARVLDGVSRRPDDHRPTTTDRIDAVLTHKLWGTLIFIAAMAVLFSSIFVLAVPVMDLIDRRVGALASCVGTADAGGRAAIAGRRWRDRRRGRGRRFPAANSDSVLLHRDAGRLRLHGPGRVFDGPADGRRRA